MKMPHGLLALVTLLPLVVSCAHRAQSGPQAVPESVTVVISTSEGDIRVQLDAARAPTTVANFLRYVDDGHYDGASFYRTVRRDNDRGKPIIEVIQGGPRSDEPIFPPIEHEPTSLTGIVHDDGVISMARDTVGTAAAEFFICIGDQPGLDHGAVRNPDGQGFAAFGRVVEGMHVVRRIHSAKSDAPGYSAYVQGQMLDEAVTMKSVRRVPATGEEPAAR